MSPAPPTGAPLTVALLSLRSHGETFLDDGNLSALRDALALRGHRPALRTITRGAQADDAWQAEVRAALSAEPFDVVVLSRAWDAALLATIRSVSPSASLVRLSHGAPAALDDRFDAVHDVEGMVDWAGGIAPRAASFRSSRDQLKQRAGVPSSADVSTGGGLPMISGPARGCPFLLDVRTSPAFADTPLDPEKLQLKGCSFCLDNVGAYAAFPEEDVVAAWLSGLRAIRAERPDAREVLLTDERPHPYLPAFFRALRDEGVAPVELLIKSRVDWLTAFAETSLSEALALAEEGGHVLHVYLIGFECFDQAHLDLYNKGVTVADNLAAVACIRALQRRFPRSLEYRRLRAHGIILFSPWTTPESLLENARHMRALGFDEFRSQALRTRLRLYPHVPLHAKAEAEGLIVDGFEAGRPDRAAEQGYDASVPWRFRDPRVEAIFRAANGLAELEPRLAEPDALELVTRFVTRWPGLAATPDDALHAVVTSLRTWGRGIADVVRLVGPALAGYDREIEGVAAGDKSACLKEGVPVGEATALVRAYRAMGLSADVVSLHGVVADSGDHRPADDRGTHAIVAVARDDETLLRVLQAQRDLEGRHAVAAVARMGELMGFPSCCTAAFLAHPDRGDNLALERAPFLAHPDEPSLPESNRLSPVSLVSHLLCRPGCGATSAIAQRILGRLEILDPAATDALRLTLASPVLFIDHARSVRLRGRWDGDRFLVEGSIAATDGRLGVPLTGLRWITVSPSGVRLGGDGGVERRVDAAYPLLVVPGSALSPAALAALRVDPDAERLRVASPRPPASAPSAALPAGLPPLPANIRSGARFGTFTILEARTRAGAHEVLLGAGRERVALRLRASSGTSTPGLRRGPWAIQIGRATTLDELPPLQRAAVGQLVRDLMSDEDEPPADATSERRDGSAATRRPDVRAPRGVVCTAPWTTMEVVDPDGQVRQCCADWTVGARANTSEGSLLSLWNGAGYREARRVMATGETGTLCAGVCPRLYDRKFGGEHFEILDGAEAYVKNQVLMAQEIAEGRTEVRSRPLYLAICPSTYCNYDCIMCLHGRSPRRELPEHIWDELPAMLPTLRVLTLLGGEPLANPLAMRFLRQFDRALYPDAAVSLITNGSLLTERTLAQLGRCSFGHITVSVNAGTADVYAAVQRGLPFAELLENIDALRRFRDAHARPFGITASFVVQPANAHTLVAFGELARTRRLEIRLLPLSPHGPEGLDYYDDVDAVARVEEHLGAFRDWAARAEPGFLAEIDATRAAIREEARGRRARGATPGARHLPLVGGGT